MMPACARPHASGRLLRTVVRWRCASRAGRRSGRRSQWLTVAGYAGLGFGCLLAATATFLLVAAPVDLVRDRAIELVKARTGRDLVIAGPTSLTYFPRFGVAFSEVSLASPPDMGGPPVLAARKLQVEMPFWSLLSKRVVARRVLLDGAVVELRVDAAGRRSWDFAAWLDRPTRLAQAGGRATDAGADVVPRGGRSLLPASNVRIVGATVRYVDERSGASREVAGIDADLATDETGGALDARGSLAWMGEKVGFEAKLSPADRDLARLSLRVAGRPFQAAYDGNVGLGREPEADGEVSIKAASWAELVQWLGRQRAATPETGALAVSAHVAAANRRIALTDLAATLGENSLAGSLTVETGGARPHVSGKLQLSELDFGRLLVRSSKTEPTGGAATDAIGDLLQGKETAPGKVQVRGFTKRSGGKGWSDEIIDLAPLGLADADLALSVDRLIYKNVATGRSRLALAVQDRVAKITLEDVQLYAGRARGTLTLDGRGQTAATTTNLTLDHVSALPLLTDALEFGWLDGRGTIVLALAGEGLSERQIVGTLRGKVELSVTRRGYRRRGYRPGARWYREGALRQSEDRPCRPDAFQRVRRLVRRRQWCRSEPGLAAEQSASARQWRGLRQSRPAHRRLHRAPEDRCPVRAVTAASLISQAWRCPFASRGPGRSRLSHRI